MRPRTALQVMMQDYGKVWSCFFFFFFFCLWWWWSLPAFPRSHHGCAHVSALWENLGWRSSSADLHLQRSGQCPEPTGPHTHLLPDTGTGNFTIKEVDICKEAVQGSKGSKHLEGDILSFPVINGLCRADPNALKPLHTCKLVTFWLQSPFLCQRG